MAKSIDEVIAQHAAQQPAKPPPPPAVQPMMLPFWVVVVNPRRQPPEPKYVFGYATEDEADRERDRRQAGEDARHAALVARLPLENAQRAALGLPPRPTAEPFRFYVIRRPF